MAVGTGSNTPGGVASPSGAAQSQVSVPADELLHSANSGLIIHRVGQVNYDFGTEARTFARDLQDHNNRALHPYLTAFIYEEVLGVEDRLHWLIHMRNPNDYGKLLEMVEHDRSFQDISLADRLPERGGGNWDKMFAQGSFRETVIVPQHGLTHADDDADLSGLFAAPAMYQAAQPPEQMLHSGNAGAIVHRTAEVRYELRKEGRAFAFEWQDLVNRKLSGDATIFLYEETWGTQDRIHWLIHLRTLENWHQITDLAAQDDDMRKLLAADVVPAGKGGGTWGRMFVEGSIRSTVLVPLGTAPVGG